MSEQKYLDLNGLIHYHKKIKDKFGDYVTNNTFNEQIQQFGDQIQNITGQLSNKASTVVNNDVITSNDSNGSTKLTVGIDNSTIKKSNNKLYAVDQWYPKTGYSKDANDLIERGVYQDVTDNCPSTNKHYTIFVLPGIETSTGDLNLNDNSNIIQLAFSHDKDTVIYKRGIITRHPESSYQRQFGEWEKVGSDLEETLNTLENNFGNLYAYMTLPTSEPNVDDSAERVIRTQLYVKNNTGEGQPLNQYYKQVVLPAASCTPDRSNLTAGLMTGQDAYDLRYKIPGLIKELPGFSDMPKPGDYLELNQEDNTLFDHKKPTSSNGENKSYVKIEVDSWGHITYLQQLSIQDIYNELKPLFIEEFVFIPRDRTITGIAWENLNNVTHVYDGNIPNLGNLILTYADGLTDNNIIPYPYNGVTLSDELINVGIYYNVEANYQGFNTIDDIPSVTITQAQMTANDMRVEITDPVLVTLSNGQESTIATVTIYGADNEKISGTLNIPGTSISSNDNVFTVTYTNSNNSTSDTTLGKNTLTGTFVPTNNPTANRSYPQISVSIPTKNITLKGKTISSIAFESSNTVTYTYGNPTSLGTISVTYNNGTQSNSITPTTYHYVNVNDSSDAGDGIPQNVGRYTITAKYGGKTTVNSKQLVINQASVSLSQSQVVNGNIGNISITKSPNISGTFEIVSSSINDPNVEVNCNSTTGEVTITNGNNTSYSVSEGSITLRFTPTNGNYSSTTITLPEHAMSLDPLPVIQSYYWYAGTTAVNPTNYKSVASSVSEIPSQTTVNLNNQILYVVAPSNVNVSAQTSDGDIINLNTYNTSTDTFTRTLTTLGDGYTLYASRGQLTDQSAKVIVN